MSPDLDAKELRVACPNCAQQPGEECRWGGVAHPRFHAERLQCAVFVDAVENGKPTDDATKPALVDQAFAYFAADNL